MIFKPKYTSQLIVYILIEHVVIAFVQMKFYNLNKFVSGKWMFLFAVENINRDTRVNMVCCIYKLLLRIEREKKL